MPGLAFLKLPLLAELNILKYVDVNELVNLSFCSEKTRAIVETASAQLEKLDIHYNGNGTGYSWFCCNDGHTIDCSSSEPLVAGRKVNAYWRHNGNRRQVVLFQSDQPMDFWRELLTDHMMKTFRNVKRVDVTYSDLPLLNIPVWKYTRSLGKFRCSTRTTGKILEQEEIEFIRDELAIDDTLIIYPPVVDGFRYSEGFAPKMVEIRHADWVQFDAILNSTSSSICLTQVERPPAALLNNFLKLWMSKEKMENLKGIGLNFKTREAFSEEYILEVLDGIVHQRNPISGDVRIQRIDGKSATLKFLCLRFFFNVDQ